MKLGTQSQRPLVFAAAILGLLSVLVASDYWAGDASPLQSLKSIVNDWQVRLALHHPARCATNFAVVYIDEPSLEVLRSGDLGFGRIVFPFPRQVYGRLARELHAEEAKGVAVDVLLGEQLPELLNQPASMTLAEARTNGFTEAELADCTHTSVGEEVIDGKTNQIPGVIVDSDLFLAVQMRQASNVILAAEFTDGIVPPPLFRTNAFALGDITTENDPDGKLRRLYPFRDHRLWHPEIRSQMSDEAYRLESAVVETNRIVFVKKDGTRFVLKTDAQGYFDPADLPRHRQFKVPPPRARAFENQRVWHMGIVLAAMELGLDLNHPELDQKNHRIVLHGKHGLERVIPLDRKGRLPIDWSLAVEDPRLFHMACGAVLSVDALRHSDTPADHLEYLRQLKAQGLTWNGLYPFRNKLVVFGSQVAGSNVRDMGPTPLSRQTYLFSTHWNVANSIVTNRFIREASFLTEWLFVVGLTLLAAWLTWNSRAGIAALCMVALGGLVVLGSTYLYVRFRYVLPVVLPVLGGLLFTHVAMVSYRVVVEQQEKRRVKSVFAKMVAPEVVNELLESERLALGGARRRVTVFFSDVRGFTEMTDIVQARAEAYVRDHQLSGTEAEQYFDAQAREVLETVNLYLSTIADRVKQHHGVLDKYMGDCVMAFWGAPIGNERHALDCVLAAIDSQRAIADLNAQRAVENQRREAENLERAKTGAPPLPMFALLSLGSGINTGVVTIGLMGSDAHGMNYTVFGREVNLASRLEGVSGRGRVIISEATLHEIQRFDADLAARCIPQPPVRPKGFQQDIKIFEVPWKLPPKDQSAV